MIQGKLNRNTPISVHGTAQILDMGPLMTLNYSCQTTTNKEISVVVLVVPAEITVTRTEKYWIQWEIFILCAPGQKRACFILPHNRLCYVASSEFSLPFSSLKLCKKTFFSWDFNSRDRCGVSFKQRLLPASLPTPLTAITFPSQTFPGFTDFSLHSRFFFFLALSCPC